MSSPQDALNSAKRYARKNLVKCCQEICEWKKTSLLEDGCLRELARILHHGGILYSLRLAEQIVVTEMMEEFIYLKENA